MLSGNDERKRLNRRTIKHKTQTVIMTVILLTFFVSCILFLLFDHLNSTTFIIIAVLGVIFYTIFISRIASNMLGYKFVQQVSTMTDVAKAIANSKDLSNRVNQSMRNDELKNLEEALNDMLQQLQNSFERQNRFVSDASHELRTPLAILKGYLDILEEWGYKDEKILTESIHSMEEETVHMRKLIENLLFLARSEQGRIPLNFQNLELKPILEKLHSDLGFICGGRNVSLNAVNGLKINGDPELITQMLRALSENSIKYTEENGKVTIQAIKNNNCVRIEIIDDGIGIPQNDLDKIFERFYRCEETRRKNVGGSGLGLALVKNITDLHSGKIFVESTEGKGTKISVVLPLAEEE